MSTESGAGERGAQHARDMQRVAAGAVADLLTAADAVGDDERIARGTHGGQHTELAHFHRYVVVLGVEAERAGHAAAAGFDRPDVELWNQAQGLLHRAHEAECFLMAMTVQERAPRGERFE